MRSSYVSGFISLAFFWRLCRYCSECLLAPKWYWQNDGEWGLALYALVSAGLLLAVSIGLRVTYAKGIAEYMDLFVWALLATSIALGCGVGGVPIHEILSPLLVLLLIVQILVSMKKGTSAARD